MLTAAGLQHKQHEKTTNLIFIALFFLGTSIASANAQMMMGGPRPSDINWSEIVEHTASEEAEGKELWEKLRSRQIACADIKDQDFGALGEYFMGQMTGNSHAAMNAMIIQMHGEDGEEKMHIVMGKRLSGCDTSAAFPNWSGGWMPMVNVMMGGWSSPSDFNQTRNSMMGNFGTNPMGWLAFGLGWLGLAWLFMIFWWLLIIAGIVFLIRWLTRQIKGGVSLWGKSALDILKERYAKGEITKHEYEEMKKEILS